MGHTPPGPGGQQSCCHGGSGLERCLRKRHTWCDGSSLLPSLHVATTSRRMVSISMRTGSCSEEWQGEVCGHRCTARHASQAACRAGTAAARIRISGPLASPSQCMHTHDVLVCPDAQAAVADLVFQHLQLATACGAMASAGVSMANTGATPNLPVDPTGTSPHHLKQLELALPASIRYVSPVPWEQQVLSGLDLVVHRTRLLQRRLHDIQLVFA